MITREGRVKILDFGLARASNDQPPDVDPALSPAITGTMTRPGVLLGTAAYMSPEQAVGKPVDKRAEGAAGRVRKARYRRSRQCAEGRGRRYDNPKARWLSGINSRFSRLQASACPAWHRVPPRSPYCPHTRHRTYRPSSLFIDPRSSRRFPRRARGFMKACPTGVLPHLAD